MANIDTLVNEAINAHRAGNNEEAERLLRSALEINDSHEMAWLWMSAVLEDTDDRIKCLEYVLDINPNNDNARRGLNRLLAEQAKKSPFLDVNADEWEDIDSATEGFMADLQAPPKSETTYRTGYEQDFDNAILDIEEEADEEEDFDPLGDFDPLDDDDDQEDYSSPSYASYQDQDDDDGDTYATTYDDDSETFDDNTSYAYEEEEDDTFASYREDAAGSSYDRGYDDFDDEEDPFGEYADEHSLDYYFMMIPDEVRPTRVPGSDDSRPVLLVLFIGLLLIGNVALATLFITNMIA